ncbi:MAG: class II glutamine amidotransferase [Fervidobacterium sp.]|uniref:class II glutamine amidotransferase n=1 Tax=Fervidobacterium sp. TaxID=1871331 RepID=UPI00404B449D
MCRMAAFSSNEYIEVGKIINSVSEMAKNGKNAPHDDGYGFVLFTKERKLEYKSVVPIFEDDFWKSVVEGFKASAGIVHARKASENLDKTKLQLHPFHISGKYLAHNGTVYDANIENDFRSDTYDFFLNIFSFDIFEALIDNVRKYIANHKYSSLNFLLYDEKEDSLYVGCIYSRSPDYFTLYYDQNEAGFVVYSENVNGDLTPMENGEILKVSNGKITQKGRVF